MIPLWLWIDEPPAARAGCYLVETLTKHRLTAYSMYSGVAGNSIIRPHGLRHTIVAGLGALGDGEVDEVDAGFGLGREGCILDSVTFVVNGAVQEGVAPVAGRFLRDAVEDHLCNAEVVGDRLRLDRDAEVMRPTAGLTFPRQLRAGPGHQDSPPHHVHRGRIRIAGEHTLIIMSLDGIHIADGVDQFGNGLEEGDDVGLDVERIDHGYARSRGMEEIVGFTVDTSPVSVVT